MRIVALACILALAATAAAATPPPPPPSSHAAGGKLSVDSPVSELMDNPRTRGVMDKHFPKLSDNPHYEMFKDMPLKDLAPMAQGKLDGPALDQINRELLAAQ